MQTEAIELSRQSFLSSSSYSVLSVTAIQFIKTYIKSKIQYAQ